MIFDGDIDIAIGFGAKSKIWKNKKMSWLDFVNKLKEPAHTSETLKEFMAASKEEQSKIKDVGGYVGGYLRAGRRKPENVVYRQMLTLDIDYGHINFWDDFIMLYANAAILHGTHKHNEASPRLRLIMPLNREVTPEEYVAIARKVAGTLDIELFDNTTFETNRLMFWQSTPKDIEYYFKFQDGAWLDADEVLSSYIDWTDSSLWPTSERESAKVKDATKKQQDPEQKKGIVGAFCRTYTIHEAIETYLADEYTPGLEDRYTYAKGSTSSGLMVYEDKFAYSHHGTDPSSGKLCNAFDLVRIHKFGHLDEAGNIVNEKSPSFKAMEELAMNSKEVRKIIASEKISESHYDFADDLEPAIDDVEWMVEMEVDRFNKYNASAHNLKLIFENDQRLKNLFRHNTFDDRKYVFGNLPWRKVKNAEPLKNVDFSGIRVYIEVMYSIVSSQKIDDALTLVFEKNSYHPIRDYLASLSWDGEERLDTLLIDYFGAKDNAFTREAMRKTLVAAVARVIDPGCKFDNVLTLVGDQGCGKSSFVKRLGMGWYSDTFMTVQGKEALEQIQGSWIIEMAELAGLRKAEVEAVKHFISKQEDTFRPAYAKTSETFKRQCIFLGTTNNRNFLKDPTGNRRFWPIEISSKDAIFSVFDDLTQQEVDQIWAEAMHLFRKNERLYLSSSAEAMAKVAQNDHSEIDERKGIIEGYLDTLLPRTWNKLSIDQRRMYLTDDDEISSTGLYRRDEVCVAELFTECLGKSKEDLSRYNTRELNDIMRGMPGWEQVGGTKTFTHYGKQKYYRRLIGG